MTAMLGAAAVIGGIATYNLEHALRTNFLETRLLNELAERDGLTGLYNRRIFDDYIGRVWRQSRREDVALEIIFVDIDYFKIYNDLYGHQAGDDCLKKVASTHRALREAAVRLSRSLRRRGVRAGALRAARGLRAEPARADPRRRAGFGDPARGLRSPRST